MATAKSNDNKDKRKTISGCLRDYFGWTLKTLKTETVTVLRV